MGIKNSKHAFLQWLIVIDGIFNLCTKFEVLIFTQSRPCNGCWCFMLRRFIIIIIIIFFNPS